VGVTLLDALKFLKKVWEHAYVVPVDLGEIKDRFLTRTMV
jgi:hypothetical protein